MDNPFEGDMQGLDAAWLATHAAIFPSFRDLVNWRRGIYEPSLRAELRNLLKEA